MTSDTNERLFRTALLHVLREIRDELHRSNQISADTNSKFDSEHAKLTERVDDTISYVEDKKKFDEEIEGLR